MSRPNDEVGAVLQEYADLLSITGGDAFRARAYEKAARAVAGHHEDVSRLDAGALRDIPGVGSSIADKVAEYLTSGTMRAIDELRTEIPAGVRELTRIPTLGPKKAAVLHRELGVSSIEELADAIESERLRELKVSGLRTSRTPVSRHAGLMSQEIPDCGRMLGHVEGPSGHYRCHCRESVGPGGRGGLRRLPLLGV